MPTSAPTLVITGAKLARMQPYMVSANLGVGLVPEDVS